MHTILPESKTYLPGPMRCIYCLEDDGHFNQLTREHIIPQKLNGKLILHRASCKACARIINQQIETPLLSDFLKSPRTHLGMPTSRPQEKLPIGRWMAPTSEIPENMRDVNFRFDQIPVHDHPFRILRPVFLPPSILWDEPASENFTVTKIQAYFDGRPTPPGAPGEQTAEFQKFSPDILLRFIAKIAHGAAVAELGLDAFSPLLPDIILGRNPFISHMVGSAIRRRRPAHHLHEITIVLRRGFIVAVVRLFNLPHSYIAVVGRAREDLATLHTSALMRANQLSSLQCIVRLT